VDIINEIIRDHRRLRELLERVKAEDISLRSRKNAFRELLPLVKAHARAEERSLYEYAKHKRGFKPRALEGHEEHAAAHSMGEKARRSTAGELWLARARVFCEMLEHHLDEEEDNFFPEMRHVLSDADSASLAAHYRTLMPPAETKQSERGGKFKVPFARPVTAPLEAFIP
jgi:hemerythrin-like domain-containing protein